MKNNKSFLGLFLAVLVLLPGCILHVPSYRAQRLRLIRDGFNYEAQEENVTVRAKLLTGSDKDDLFGEHIGALEGNDFKVIYVSIHNLSDKNYVFMSRNIDLKQVPSKDILKAMKKTSSIGRLATYYAASTTTAMLGAISADVSGNLFLCLSVASLSIGFTVVGLVGLVQGIKSIVMNTRVRRDIEEKVLPKKEVINSGQYCDGLIFVKATDYKPEFNVIMFEKNNWINKLTFDVDLSQNEQKE